MVDLDLDLDFRVVGWRVCGVVVIVIVMPVPAPAICSGTIQFR